MKRHCCFARTVSMHKKRLNNIRHARNIQIKANSKKAEEEGRNERYAISHRSNSNSKVMTNVLKNDTDSFVEALPLPPEPASLFHRTEPTLFYFASDRATLDNGNKWSSRNNNIHEITHMMIMHKELQTKEEEDAAPFNETFTSYH